jgi:hypothetical protein
MQLRYLTTFSNLARIRYLVHSYEIVALAKLEASEGHDDTAGKSILVNE